jgi:flagellar M-ring protein FliF
MQALRELVASTVGFDEERGDTITLKSMEFSPLETQGTEVTSSLTERFAFDAMSLIQLAVLGIVTLVLGLFVVRPILAGRAAESRQAPALAAPTERQAAESRAADDLADLPALDGEIDDGASFEAPSLADFGFDGTPALGGGAGSSDAVARLRQLIEERREETVGVLRSWMEDSGDRA